MSKFEDCIQEGDKVVYNEDLGCRVNLSQLKRVAKKDNYVKADYCSKELCLLLSKKGIEASYCMRFEKGGSWYKRYTHDIACEWLRKVHQIGVFPSTYCITVGGKVTHPYGTCIIDLRTHNILLDDCMPRETFKEAREAAIRYCVENLI